MNTDYNTFVWKLHIDDVDLTIHELICQVLDNKLKKDEFWKEYHKCRALIRIYEACLELDLPSLDWTKLEECGMLCRRDYKTFELTEKFGMTWENGKKKFEMLTAVSHNGSAPVLKTECG